MPSTGRLIASIHDDSPTPLVGRVLGHEDEDRVHVAWGDSMHSDDPWTQSRIEWIDELAPI